MPWMFTSWIKTPLLHPCHRNQILTIDQDLSNTGQIAGIYIDHTNTVDFSSKDTQYRLLVKFLRLSCKWLWHPMVNPHWHRCPTLGAFLSSQNQGSNRMYHPSWAHKVVVAAVAVAHGLQVRRSSREAQSCPLQGNQAFLIFWSLFLFLLPAQPCF